MNGRAGSSAALLLALAAVCVFAPLIGFVVLFGGDVAGACAPPGDELASTDDSIEELTQEQLTNAATIVAAGNRMGIPRRGIVVALAVASQESRFLNYANDGEGADLAPDQRGIEASLRLPHQAVGTDHGSLGVFQQQWPWWGSMTELMAPGTAAEKFYTALLNVPGWDGMPVTVAGQAVQRSAFPDAYADDEALALELLADPAIASATVNAVPLAAGSGCGSSTAGKIGGIVFPLPTSATYVDRANWGNRGAHWSRGHTGTDLSTACGTPVLAATGGTVIVRTDQPWSGRWLVQVSTGRGQLTTWYAHMRAITVRAGDTVRAGERIGEVGSEGNSTGCHLHFEVHPRGGSIYADSIHPTRWLAEQVGRAPDVSEDGSPLPEATR